MSKTKKLMPVAEARGRVLAAISPLATESVAVGDALGRVLAEDVISALDHPAADKSAMDGYAVRAADCAKVPARLKLIGEAPAGRPFDGKLKKGEALRIFTGAVVPEGADAIAIQENCTAKGKSVTVNKKAVAGRHIRRKGGDFRAGDTVLRRGMRLTPQAVSLAAAANAAKLTVGGRPRVAILSTGDELVPPGGKAGIHQVVESISPMLKALIEAYGGDAVPLGIAPDNADAIAKRIKKAGKVDLLVTIGGASVGDYDLVHDALAKLGFTLDFWKVAVKPGKPLMFGTFEGTPVLGLPGNPVSAMVCAVLFLAPALDEMQGAREPGPGERTAVLAVPLGKNGPREAYLRAKLLPEAGGQRLVAPHANQDSASLSSLATADCLLKRPANAPAAEPGEIVTIIFLDH